MMPISKPSRPAFTAQTEFTFAGTHVSVRHRRLCMEGVFWRFLQGRVNSVFRALYADSTIIQTREDGPYEDPS